MKKISIANAITVLAASAFLIACNAYDQDLSPGGNTVIEAVCPAPALEEPATRTAVDPTAYTSGEIGINWLPADRIGVYSATTANACFTNQSDQETDKTSFAGNLQNGETPLYAYYPYTETAGELELRIRIVLNHGLDALSGSRLSAYAVEHYPTPWLRCRFVVVVKPKVVKGRSNL